jgi:hypothetical protein
MKTFINDADTLLLNKQLEQYDNTVYTSYLQALQAAALVSPVAMDYESKNVYTYERQTLVGGGAATKSFRANAPLSGAFAEKISQLIHPIITAADFDAMEIRMGVDSLKLTAAARNNAEAQNSSLLYTDSSVGTKGLLNHGDVTISGTALIVFSSSTAAEIADFMIAGVDTVAVSAKGTPVLAPTHVLMSLADFQAASRKRDSIDGATALQIFQAARPGVTVLPVFGLETAGGSLNKRRMIVYNNRPEIIQGLYSGMFQTPATPAPHSPNYVQQVSMHSYSGGVVLRAPVGLLYFDAA